MEHWWYAIQQSRPNQKVNQPVWNDLQNCDKWCSLWGKLQEEETFLDENYETKHLKKTVNKQQQFILSKLPG